MKIIVRFILILTIIVAVSALRRSAHSPLETALDQVPKAIRDGMTEGITSGVPAVLANVEAYVVVTNLGADGSILLVTNPVTYAAYGAVQYTPEQMKELRDQQRARLMANDQFKPFFAREAVLKEKVKEFVLGATTVETVIAALGQPTQRVTAPQDARMVLDYSPNDVLHRSSALDRVRLLFDNDGKLEGIEWEQ
jgi:hypothetical protein